MNEPMSLQNAITTLKCAVSRPTIKPLVDKEAIEVVLAAVEKPSTASGFYGHLPEGMTAEWLLDHMAEESGVSPTRVKDAMLACFRDAKVKPILNDQDVADAGLSLLDWRKRAEKAEQALATLQSGISSLDRRPNEKDAVQEGKQ